jgi:hypothetical protein
MTILIFLLLSQPTFAKPFLHVVEPNENYVKNEAIEKEKENRLNCHIQKNLGEYSTQLLKSLIPRLTQELSLLTTLQKDATGNYILVGESIDYGDLFHSHVRAPLLDGLSTSGLDPRLIDSSYFHLQYHSFETTDLYRQTWIEQLSQIPDAELQSWLLVQIKSIGSAPVGSSSPFDTPAQKVYPDRLSVDQRLRFAKLWLEQSKQTRTAEERGWLLERYIEKLRYIDQGDRSYPSHLTSNRSVASSDDAFTIIRPLAIEGYRQAATFYFSRRSENPEVDRVIRELESEHVSILFNPKSLYFMPEFFPANVDWEKQEQQVNRLRSAALAAKNPRATFKNALLDDYDFERHVAFSWNSEYLFSLRYFIPCK